MEPTTAVFYLIVWAILALVSYKEFDKKNRNIVVWLLLTCFVSPLISLIVGLCLNKKEAI